MVIHFYYQIMDYIITIHSYASFGIISGVLKQNLWVVGLNCDTVLYVFLHLQCYILENKKEKV